MTWRIFLCVLILVVMVPSVALAYIDPGTGALGVQILLALIATAIVTVKLWWARFLALFKKDKSTDNSKENKGGNHNDK